MKTLEQIVNFLDAGATWAELLLPDGTPPDIIAKASGILLRIAKSSIRAHESVTGKPLDLALLKELPHV